MLIPDALPPDLRVWPHAARDSLPPYFREVGEADGGIIDDPEVLAPGDVAENAVEHFSRDPLAGSDLLAMPSALRVLEVDPPCSATLECATHRSISSDSELIALFSSTNSLRSAPLTVLRPIRLARPLFRSYQRR